METRGKSAAKKRKMEQDEEVKRAKEMFAPRKDGVIGPNDVYEDPEISSGHLDEVKIEIKKETIEEEGVQLGCDGEVKIEDHMEEVQLAWVGVVKVEDVMEEEGGGEGGAFQDEEGIVEKEADGGFEGFQQDEEMEEVADGGRGGLQQDEDEGGDQEMEEEGGNEGGAVFQQDGGIQGEGDGGAEVFQQDEDTLKKVLCIVLPCVELNNVLSCRQVNKQWRQIVDTFLEETVVSRPYDDEVYLQKVKGSPNELCPLPKLRRLEYSAYRFENETTLEKFNDAMKGQAESGSSPFVGGATVILKNLLQSSTVTPATNWFLEKFGAHIRRLEIHQEENERYRDFDIVGFVKCVKKCVEHVPNLERLKLKANQFSIHDQSKLADLRLKVFQIEIVDRMPKLKKLDALEFEYFRTVKVDQVNGRVFSPPDWDCVPYLEEIFGDIMITPYYQIQLKSLTLDRTNGLLNLQVDKVKELSLVNLQCGVSEIKLQSPVEKLTLLDLGYRKKKTREGDVDKIFPGLKYVRIDHKSLENTLKDVNAKWHKIYVHTLEIMEFETYKEIFPNLKNAFPHLRWLIIRERESDYVGWVKYEVRRGFAEIGRMKIGWLFNGRTTYNSDLWKDLPKLELFTFQFLHHVGYANKELDYCPCSDRFWKERKSDCPFQNFDETREGHQRYIERKIVTVDNV